MLSFPYTREALYSLVAEVFKSRQASPVIVELGVHSGSNAVVLMDRLKPSQAYFVDSWDSKVFCDNYLSFDDQPGWLDPLDAFDHYYHGSVRNQRPSTNSMLK